MLRDPTGKLHPGRRFLGRYMWLQHYKKLLFTRRKIKIRCKVVETLKSFINKRFRPLMNV